MIRHPSVREWIDQYVTERQMGDSGARVLRCHWRCWFRWAGDERWPAGSDVARYLAHMAPTHAAASLVGVRASLLSVTRWAAEQGVCEAVRCRPVRAPELLPEAWTVDEVRLLVAAGYDRGEWWGSVIQAGWHSGLRWLDVTRIERRQFDGGGNGCLIQHKTGRAVAVWLPPMLIATRPATGPMWAWRWSYEHFRRQFVEVVSAAGIPHGSWKRLRKSAGNAAEELAPGRGHLVLGNTRRVFEAAYLVRSASPVVRLPLVG